MSVAISLVRAVVDELERQGHAGTEVLREVGIAPGALEDPVARIDDHTYDRLHQCALAVTGDPAFGLHMGEHASVAAFSLVGHMATQSRSLRQVLDALLGYYRIVADIEPPRLIEDGDHARIVYEYVRSPDPACNRVRTEFGLVRMMIIGRAFLGPGALPEEAWFEHGRPSDDEHAAEYARIFSGCERFDRPHAGLVVPRAILDATQVYHDESLLVLMKARADRLLSDLGDDASLSKKVQHLIVHHFSGTRPSMEAVARQMGMSARTMRRHLQGEGTTFGTVTRDAMAELARRMLEDRNSRIQEIAYRLGFADVSSFHRAFKRWTGQTPADYRQQSGPGSSSGH